MLSRLASLFLQRTRSIRRFVANGRRALCVELVTVSVAFVLPAASQGQAVPSQLSSVPKTTVFLADPQLGVVGAYQSAGQTLYFEARSPEGSTQMSARLLDAVGRTIAISGHSMDRVWRENTSFDAASAAHSLSIAGTLPADLAHALDATVFAREIAAISALASAAAKAPAATTAAITIDSAAANLASPNESDAAAAINYDIAAADGLHSERDAQGNLNTTFHGILAQTFVEYFPDAPNENGTIGLTEVSARLRSPDGMSLIQQLGGDNVPVGWDRDVFRAAPTTRTGALQRAVEAGDAIRAAALMERFPSIATPQETEAISHLAAALRDDSLLPNPPAAQTSGSVSPNLCPIFNCVFQTNVQVWRKPLVVEFLAEHSGSIVRHWYSTNYGLSFVFDYETVYCNHGTCPRASGMTHTCTYLGPILTYYRYPPHARINSSPGIGQMHSCWGTPYHLDSGFLFWDHPGHNCNDDTWTQVRAIRGESEGPNSYRCNDWALDDYAPGCNS